jgi:hypothetical protein
MEGHLVEMNCGHRGTPHRQEEKRISRLMRKSGFIPMLEDMPRDKVKIIVQNVLNIKEELEEKKKAPGATSKPNFVQVS